jgi:thiol:disulfide interchange protein DsbD
MMINEENMRIKQRLVHLLLFIAFLAPIASLAEGVPLPADQAFKLSITLTPPNQIITQWQIAPGYYLYRKQTQVIFEPAAQVDVRFPQGELRYDTIRGRYEAFSGSLMVPTFLKVQQNNLKMRVNYQGCSQDGFCYPPMSQSFTLDFSKAAVAQIGTQVGVVSLQTLSQDQNSVRDLLSSQSLGVMLLIFAGLGLLLAFTPCVLPMIPILTSIIIGQSQKITPFKAFLLSSAYVLGAAVTYAIAGVIAAWMGNSLQVWLQQPWIIMAVSGLFALLGLSMFGLYDLRLPHQVQNKVIQLSNKQKGGTYAGVFAMGMISTLIVSPCVTAPMVGILLYIGQTGNMLLGAGTLFVMGLGMGIPLILIGVSAGKWLPKSGVWMGALKKIFGLLMFAMAIWLLSRVAPLTVTLFLIGVLMVGVAIFTSVYFARSLGYVLGLLGIAIMVGGLIAPNRVNSFKAFAVSDFKIVHNVRDLSQQLALAEAAHKPVILDFYASWCDSCVAMDKNVFAQAAVRKAMRAYVLLRADLSANNAEDAALLKRYAVTAPPMVLFFNADGKELVNKRIVGEVNADEFLTRLGGL